MEALETLPARIDGLQEQIVHLRSEMTGEFSAVRAEMREQGEQLRAEMREQGEQLRAEMREQGDELRAEMREQGDNLRQQLRSEIREGDEATRTLMRVLHEEVIERLKTIQNG